MKYTPHPYQPRAGAFLRAHPRCHFWLDMGLGKTVVALTEYGDMLAGYEIRAVLVVSTIRVICNVWPDEIQQWDHTKWMRYSIIRGTAAERMAAIEKPAEVYLINFEMLAWLDEVLPTNPKRVPWDCIIFDESSKMKSPKAKRFKKFKARALAASRVVCMTGTPRPNSFLDIWAPTYLLDGGERLGQKFTHFRDRWFDYNPYSHMTKIKGGADADITRRIRDLTICMRSEDYIKLPPIIYNTVTITLPPAVMAQYKKFEKDMLIRMRCGGTVEATNAAALSLKCRQLTSGAVYLTDDLGRRTGTAVVHDEKLTALEDIIDEAGGEPVLAVYEFKHELARYLKKWPRAPWIGGGSKNADANIRNWKAGKVPLMFVHPASVGHGINLQSGGRIMVWLSGTWSLEAYQQMIKRLWRQGQSKPVMVHLLVAKGTTDEVVAQVLRDKKQGQDALLNALRTLSR